MTIVVADDSWLSLDPVLPPGNTSQVFLGYDPKNKILMTWGGHLYGGGYPQIDDLYTYDISDLENENTWKLENTQFVNTSECPIGGCLSDGIYDTRNELMFKKGQHIVDTHDYYRKANLEKWPWIYDFKIHKWFDVGAFNYKDGSNYSPGVCYDHDSHIVMILDARNNIRDRTIIYDAYENKVTLIPLHDWSILGGTRSDMGLVYDSKRKKFVVVGGIWVGSPDILQRYNDIWTFDFESKIWVLEEAVNPEIIPTEDWVASDAVYDSVNDRIILFLGFNVYGTTEHNCDGRYIQTYAYDPETKVWERLADKPEYFCGHRAQDLNATFSAEHNITFILDSCTLSKTWAYRYLSNNVLPTEPDPPENVLLNTAIDSAIITWDQINPTPKEYNIYRGQGVDPWDIQYTLIDTVPPTTNTYIDLSVVQGTKYFYYITSVDNNDIESKPSMKVRTQIEAIREGYVVIQDTTQTQVVWTPPTAVDIEGFNIYRAECDLEVYPLDTLLNLPGELDFYTRPVIKNIVAPAEEDYIKVNTGLITANEYIDTIDLVNSDESINYPFKVFVYKVRSVNKQNVESGWSTYFSTIPNPPTGPIVCKSGTDYLLNWTAPHNEEGIKGYRIYTTEDRHDIKEVTTNIVTTTEAIIPMADILDPTQMFYITAIDLIDQEGAPSSGVWGTRIYGEFYEQYIVSDIDGDLNDDNILDINDYAMFLNTFGSNSGDIEYILKADHNNDGKVTYNDFKEWYTLYLASL